MFLLCDGVSSGKEIERKAAFKLLSGTVGSYEYSEGSQREFGAIKALKNCLLVCLKFYLQSQQ